MVPVAKAAILLVLLGGATVSTYAVANGGFGNKAKGSEENKGAGTEDKGSETGKGDASAASGQNEGSKDSSPSVSPEQGERGAQEGGESATRQEAGKAGPAAGKGEADSASPGGSSRPEEVRTGEGNTPGNTGSHSTATTPGANVTQQ